ncbi:MAG TPA: hypothetical protein VHQ87_00790 [Rhizobacter sp.]|jgi:hypothetical protein|nr:hypothetical protein [Rhizobacter sp.]
MLAPRQRGNDPVFMGAARRQLRAFCMSLEAFLLGMRSALLALVSHQQIKST